MSRLGASDIEGLLVRDDKISLGGGGRVLWAPEFPLHADVPGFWDHACYLEHSVRSLLTLALVDREGRAVPLRLASRRWLPGRVHQLYEAGDGFEIEEVKTFLSDVLISQLRWRSGLPEGLRVVVWTVVAVDELGESPAWHRGCWEWSIIRPGLFGGPATGIALALGADQAASSWAAHPVESTCDLPRWELTPFYETLRPEGLAEGEPRLTGPWESAEHLSLYLGQEYAREALLEADRLTVGMAMAPDRASAGVRLRRALDDDPVDRASSAWADYWTSVPSFSCSDPYLERAYWYRWFGLRLNSVGPSPDHGLAYPCVFEGINPGWFRHAIAYSAQAHMRDLRWAHDPAAARGSLLNFLDHQLPDGSLPGYVSTSPGFARPSFYHGSWGTGVLRVHGVHPDIGFLRRVYEPLERYARYFQDQRDPEGSHLYDVLNHWETGQEYSSRYLPADPDADRGNRLRLKGVDATSYMFELYDALAWMAGVLGRRREQQAWEMHARATAQAVREHLWDPQLRFFTDLVPKTGQRTGVLAAVGLYPFMSELATTDHVPAIYDHLLDPRQFWTEHPVPSLALTEPGASPMGEWKGVRADCPWNGRSWLMTTSHVSEALARAARTLDSGLRPWAVELTRRCVRMTFLACRLDRPTSYEYYNPQTGQAPHFRGTDDYMHSWMVDLLVGQVAGLQPTLDGDLLVDPLPFGLDRFAFEDGRVKGRRVDVRWERGRGLTVDVDGATVARRGDLGPLRVQLGR